MVMRTPGVPVEVDRAMSGVVDSDPSDVVPPRPGEGSAPGEVWRRAGRAFDAWMGGNSVALDELVREMTPVLWHVVRAYRLSEEAAEDVIQTTWLALVRSRNSITDGGAVAAWLTTSARREAWRSIKAAGRAAPMEDEQLGHRLPAQESVESTVVEHDSGQALWAAVDSLPERCRRLLRIVAFEHRPDYQRLSADLGMPVGSIGPTRGRCLQKLKTALEERGAW